MSKAQEKLALNGGSKAVAEIPPRGLFGIEEKRAVDALFDKCIASGQVFGYNGEEEEAYCREFAAFFGGGYADAVNSGTTAVYVALRALDIEPLSEVIVPPVTDPGGVMPVPLCGLIPVPADSAPDSYNVGPDQIEARITQRTRAIIVAHIAGYPCDMGPIMELARAKKLLVIEDCAQSHGAKWHGRYVGTFGHANAFSTMSGKHHATGAQGGVVFTRDEATYWRARRCSDRGKPFGLTGATSNVVCALNLNSNDLASCIGRVQLRKLPKIVAARRRSALKIGEGLRALKAARLMPELPKSESAFWFLFVKLDLDKFSVDKATIVKALKAEGVPADESYLHLWPRAEWYKQRAVFGKTGWPWSAPEYKGNPDQEYPTPNIIAADATHIRVAFHESVPLKTAGQIVKAFAKVEAAYLK